MMYRIRYGLVDIDWTHYLVEYTSRTRGHSSRFRVPHCSTQVFFASFFPRTTRDCICNALKFDPPAVPSLNAFKSALRSSII
jgi:hypothetical protein